MNDQNRSPLSIEIQYTKAAEKFFLAHEDVRKQYESTMAELLTGKQTANIDVKRIQGKRSVYYRLRLGGWRVVYAVINGRIVVVQTLLAGPRGDIYKKMSGLK